MIVDDNYFRGLMHIIAVQNDDDGKTAEEVEEIRERVKVVLQQGKALLARGKKKFDQKFTIEVPTWRDFE
jgi:hypothetical protein